MGGHESPSPFLPTARAEAPLLPSQGGLGPRGAGRLLEVGRLLRDRHRRRLPQVQEGPLLPAPLHTEVVLLGRAVSPVPPATKGEVYTRQ